MPSIISFPITTKVATKADIGLPLADNTADPDKPISIAQAAVNTAQVAINTAKADAAATTTALVGKQATLVSASNIKTINGTSVLGAGDLVISGIGTGIDGGAPSSTYGGTTSINGGSP